MRVAVVGAGLAGLACAVDLVRADIDVTVYEARDRVGGRVWSDVMPDGSPFERGGEFIETGYDHMLRRAAEYGLAVVPQGFEFAAREVRLDGRSHPSLLLEAAERLRAAGARRRRGGCVGRPGDRARAARCDGANRAHLPARG